MQVQRDFEELPASAAEALRASLLELLVRYASAAAAVRTQLCLALAAMAAHVPAQQWGKGGIVGWLADNLGRQQQDVALPCMLELLTVIPEVSATLANESDTAKHHKLNIKLGAWCTA